MIDEGRVIENVPGDPGGLTAYGLTFGDINRYFTKFVGRPATIEDVKGMNDGLAMRIFNALYWLPLGLDKVINDNVATVILDQCVLRGEGYIKKIQSILGVSADGIVGPKTIAAINGERPNALIDAIEKDCEKFYNDLEGRNHSLLKFLKGWLNRCRRLLKLEQ